MPLPELIEIVPLDKPVRAEITVPGSKSITNRALILAALADGEVTLTGALWSEDTQIMVECLEKLGFEIRVENDPDEFCNRTIMVKGLGGKIPNSGTAENPLELFVGNAGTAARFLSAFVCLGNGVYRLSGVARMHERPQAALFQALRELGYRVESENGNDKLPVKIFGNVGRADLPVSPDARQRVPTKSCKVSIEESSQFASALLLCAKVGGWKIEVVGENAEESPYVAMTLKLMEAFPKNGGTFQIEPDASSGSYFWAADFLLSAAQYDINVRNWVQLTLQSGYQIDAAFLNFLPPVNKISRLNDLGDSIMTVAIIAPFAPNIVQLTDLGRLRVQECERVMALQKELTKCGVKIIDHGARMLLESGERFMFTEDGGYMETEGLDTLEIFPARLDQLHGAEIETYNDHRMAMCFAILGLKVPGIKIKNPACVKKTFPNFFQKLAAQPPDGLGATILEAKSGRKLAVEELFAD